MLGGPDTVNPPLIDASSTPVCSVKLMVPSGAVGLICNCAVALVGLIIVIEVTATPSAVIGT